MGHECGDSRGWVARPTGARSRSEPVLTFMFFPSTALQDAQRVLTPVKKEMRGCNKELADAVKSLDEAIARHLTKAERENATVYLQVCFCTIYLRLQIP